MPKTGGTTLNALLRASRRRVAAINSIEDARALAAEDSSSFSNADAVSGHMPMSIRDLFPNIECAVFLRDPVKRVVSAYRHVARVKEHPNHNLVANGMTLAEYATKIPPEINAQVRRLANYQFLDEADSDGRYWWNRYGIQLNRAIIGQAKENLERCAFVGLYEEFEWGARAWGAMFGIAVPDEIPCLNAELNPVDIDERTRSVIAEANALDQELYDHAKRLISRRVGDH